MAALAVFGIISTAQAGQDECQSWMDRVYPVTLAVCSYPCGGSGYYSITNNGGQTSASGESLAV